MIVRMSKVEIVGRKNLLLAVLSVIRKLGVFQIEHDYRGFLEDGREADIAELAPDEQVIAERLTVEDLGAKIDELTACLPKIPVRESLSQSAGCHQFGSRYHRETSRILRKFESTTGSIAPGAGGTGPPYHVHRNPRNSGSRYRGN